MNLENRFAKKAELVDIHGRSFPLYVLSQKAEDCAAVADLQQTGFGIYQRTYFSKLSKIQQSDFNDEYHAYMLEAAAKYMLENKNIFTENQILSAISGCKQELLKSAGTPYSKCKFLQKRELGQNGEDSFGTQRTVLRDSALNGKPNHTTSRQSLHFPLKKSNEENSNFQVNNVVPSTSHQQLNRNEIDVTSKSQQNSKQALQKKIDVKQKEASSISKLRLPKTFPGDVYKSGTSQSKDLKKVPTVIYDCVVTCIDKPNCIWVRDTSNDELFTKVFNMANEEAEQQSTALKPWHTDKVYLAQDDDSWYRCKIIKYLPLTVFFLDYGNVSQVNEIRELSPELATIPNLAVRITFKIFEYNPVLEDEIRIKVFMQNDDGTYLVNVLSHSTASNSELRTSTKPAQVQQFFHRKNYLSGLRNGLRVIIIHEEQSLLYLRCRDGVEKLQQIEKTIKAYTQCLKKVDTVSPNQSVLYRDLIDKEFKRVVVQKVVKDKAQIEYIDYIKNDMVKLDDLYMTTEEIGLAPITHLPGKKLVGFTDKHFGIIERQIIKKSIESQKEYTVIFNSDSSLDLQAGSDILSDLLQNNERVTLKDIQAYKPECGLDTYLCGCFINSSDFSVVSTNALKKYQSDVFQNDVDVEPYSPLINEACLALYDGDYWYRCVITRILNYEYEVLFVDFGNIEIIEKNNIRKANEATWKIPALAVPCRLINIPQKSKFEERLKQLIRIGEIYQVHIKDISDGKCNAEIPTVYEKL